MLNNKITVTPEVAKIFTQEASSSNTLADLCPESIKRVMELGCRPGVVTSAYTR